MDPSVTTTESPPSAQRTFRSILPPRASVMALVAMAAAFAPGVLPYWTYQLDPKPHLQFAILLPFVGLYLLSCRWPSPDAIGPGSRPVVTLLAGIAALLLGLSIVAHSSLVWVAGGLVAALAALWDIGGLRLLRRVWPCWALLLLMIPPPLGVDQLLIFKLQLLATKAASRVLDGIPAVAHVREGNVIHLETVPLFVAEACSGINSLFSSVALVLCALCLVRRSVVHSALLVLLSVGVDLGLNIARIVGLAWGNSLSSTVGKMLDREPAHTLIGLAAFGLTALLIVLFDAFLSTTIHVVFSVLPKAIARWRDPEEDLARTPAAFDFPYGGPTMILSRWLSPGPPEQTSPPLSPADRVTPGPSTWRAITAVFALLFAIQVPMLLRGQADPGELRVGDLQGRIPADWNGWKRQSYGEPSLSKEFEWARDTRSWTYSRGDRTLRLHVHFTYTHWHPFEACYEGSGWVVTNLSGGRIAGVQSFPYTCFDADRKPDGPFHFVYTHVDPRNGLVPIPMTRSMETWSFLERLKARLLDVQEGVLSVGVVLMIQTKPGDRSVEQEARALLADARARLLPATGGLWTVKASTSISSPTPAGPAPGSAR